MTNSGLSSLKQAWRDASLLRLVGQACLCSFCVAGEFLGMSYLGTDNSISMQKKQSIWQLFHSLKMDFPITNNLP